MGTGDTFTINSTNWAIDNSPTFRIGEGFEGGMQSFYACDNSLTNLTYNSTCLCDSTPCTSSECNTMVNLE